VKKRNKGKTLKLFSVSNLEKKSEKEWRRGSRKSEEVGTAGTTSKCCKVKEKSRGQGGEKMKRSFCPTTWLNLG